MIKSISVKNFLDESVELELTRPDKTGFIIKSIDGLGPSKATINTSDIATTDIGIFNSARLEKRNITLNLQFMRTATESIEDIRHKSYQYFLVKSKIQFTVKTDRRTLICTGYIESNEPDIFSKEEGCNISIICPDPFFYSPDNSIHTFSGIEPTFEFPFEDPIENPDVPDLEMSVIKNDLARVVHYEGDSEIGFTIRIYITGIVHSPSIANLRTNELFSINTSKLVDMMNDDVQNEEDYISHLIEGDLITINTQKGNKSITLMRDGKNTNILNCIKKGSKWLSLNKGDNLFAYTATVGTDYMNVTIFNKNAYNGV